MLEKYKIKEFLSMRNIFVEKCKRKERNCRRKKTVLKTFFDEFLVVMVLKRYLLYLKNKYKDLFRVIYKLFFQMMQLSMIIRQH